MVSHKHSFQCFDAIMDKPSLTFGHCCASPRSSSHPVELLDDRGCSLCTEFKQAKSMTSEAQGTQSMPWYQPQTQNHQQIHRRPMRPDGDPAEGVPHHHHHHRHSKRIVLVKNSNPSIQKTIMLRHTHVRSLGVFMDDVSELMQCLIRKLYTLDGRKIDSIQSLLQCPSILVCVGHETFHPLSVDSFQKKSDDKLPKLVLKSQSTTCNEDQGYKNNGTFGLKTKKTVPPREANSFPQARENMMDDDIEKRILVNKDGSLSMEMKVRFRLLNNETLHCSTEIKKSSGIFNTGHDNGFCFQHNNSESFSEAESLSAGDADHTYITKRYQKHMETPHFCTHCKDYDTWKNPVLVEGGPVRHIRSSSSSASSNKIKYKKASVESMHTMSSEECTEQIVEKATCVQHTVGEEGNTTVEYCNISRCSSRTEVCQVSERTKNGDHTEHKCGDGDRTESFINDGKISIHPEDIHSQVLASLNKDKEAGLPSSDSGTSKSNNQENDKQNRDPKSSPYGCTPCKSPESSVQSLSPRTTSPASVKSKTSRKMIISAVQENVDLDISDTASSPSHCQYKELKDEDVQVRNVLCENDIQNTVFSNNSTDLTDPIVINENISTVYVLAEQEYEDTKARNSEIAGSAFQQDNIESISSAISATSNTSKESAELENRAFDSSIVSHEEKAPSTMSDRSNDSARSRQEILSDVAPKETMEAKERHPSAISINTNTSALPKQSRLSPLSADECTEIEDQTEERISSALSTVSRSCSSKISELDASELREEEDEVEDRSPSTMSVSSNISEATPVQFVKIESPDRATSATPTKSNASVKSNKSKTSPEIFNKTEPRLSSAMSVKSDISVISKTSNISEINPEDAIEEQATTAKTKRLQEPEITSAMSTVFVDFETSKKCKHAEMPVDKSSDIDKSEERAPSAMSEKSNSPMKANKSKISVFAVEQATESHNANTSKSNHSTKSRNSTLSILTNEEPAGSVGQIGKQTPSTLSITSEKSNKSNLSANTDDEYEASEEQCPGVMTYKSNVTEGSMQSEVSEFTYDESEGMEGQTKKRAESPMSDKPHISAGFMNLNGSVSETFENLVERTDSAKLNYAENTERPLSVLSTKSNKSNKSDTSVKSKESKVSTQKYERVDEDTERRTQSVLSFRSNASGRSESPEVSEIAICKPSEEEARASSTTSLKSNTSRRSKRSAVSEATDTKIDLGKRKERPTSAMSAKSSVSNMSEKSSVLEEVYLSAQYSEQPEERPASTVSRTSAKSKKSVLPENEEAEAKQTDQRPQSVMSAVSSVSARSTKSRATETTRQGTNDEDYKERAASAISCKTTLSDKSNKSKSSATIAHEPAVVYDIEQEQPSTADANEITSESVRKETERTHKDRNESRTSSTVSAKQPAADGQTQEKVPTSVTEAAKPKSSETDDYKPNSEENHNIASFKTSSNSELSVTSKRSESFETVPSSEIENQEAERTPSTSVKSNTYKKSTVSYKSYKEDNEAKEENLEERSASAVSVKSNTSARSKGSNVQSEQVAECKDEVEKIALSPISIKSSTSAKQEALHISKTSIGSNIDPGKSGEAGEMKAEERASSSMSVKSKASSRSLKSKSTKTGDLNERSTSSLSTKSKRSVKSKELQNYENIADVAKEKQDRESNLENKLDTSGKSVKCVLLDNESNSLKCLCSDLKPSATMAEISKNDAGCERADSALSKRSNASVKSNTTSVHSNSEGVFTPASASVSIGVVEEYDVDEEGSVSLSSVHSKSQSGVCCKASLNITEKTNQHGTETPDDRPKSSLTAKTSVSDKSRKSKSTQSGNDDEMASNKSVTKKLTKSDSYVSVSSSTGRISPSREIQVSSPRDALNRNQEPSKVSDITTKSSRLSLSSNSAHSDLGTSRTKQSKSSASHKRPKSNASNTSYHLEVKGQSSNATAKSNTYVQSKRPNNTNNENDENETTRPQSSDISVSSENQPISRSSESFNKSKECAIVLSGFNHPVMSQSVSALESSGENGKNLTTTEDFKLHFKTCNGPPDAIDCSRIINDNNSESSSKSEIRKTDESLQQTVDNDFTELVPSILPSTSPTEVVNEWLKNIPLDSALYDAGDEFHENYEDVGEYQRSRLPNMSGKVTQNEKGIGSETEVDAAVLETGIEETGSKGTKIEDMGRKADKERTIKKNYQPEIEAFPRSVPSSVKVMRVLLSPSLDRCNSLPEVSSVYGQKLSTSARGFLDCLVNLQLLDVNPSDMNEKYKDLMNMLQSLWLCGPHDTETITHQQPINDYFKANSSSGIKNDGTTGSGNKSHTNGEGEGRELVANVRELDGIKREEAFKGMETKSDSATPDIASRVQWTPENDTEVCSSSKSCGNDSNAKQELNDQKKDKSSGTPISKQKNHIMKKISQDPDPLWVLNLLNKIQKQFMTHYVTAMTEFKARWKLDDSEQIDVMISELRDEVHKRIQSSINNELKKIQGRAGRPRPPKDAMTRESTAQTEQRRRRLNVMRNQSTQPAKTDDDYTGTGTDFSDQRSDDEYCPCDTCIKKRMATRSVMPVNVLNSAPVMMDFDLRKILHLKTESPTNNKENRKKTENQEQNSNFGNLIENVQSSRLLDDGSENENNALLLNDTDNMKTVTTDTIGEEEDKLTAPVGEDTGDVEEVCDELDEGNMSGQCETEGEKQATKVETVDKNNTVGDQEAAKDKSMTEVENSDVEIAEGEEIAEDENIDIIKSKEERKRKESETAEMDISESESAKEGEIPDDVTEEHEDETVEATINKIVPDEEEVIRGSSERIKSLDAGTEEDKPEEAEKSETTDYGETGDISKENSETEHECEPVSNVKAVRDKERAEAVDNEVTPKDETARDGERADDGIAEAERSEDVEIHKPEDALAVDDQKSEEGETEEAETADEDITDDERAENGEKVDNGIANGERSEDALTADETITTDGETEKAESADEDSSDETVDDGESLKAEIVKNGKMVNDGTAEDGETADNETEDDPDIVSDEIPTDGETKKSETSDGEERACDESSEDKAETASDEDATDETEENTDTGKIETVEDEVTADEESSEGGETLEGQKRANIMTAESEETDDDRTAEDEVVNEAKVAKDEESTDGESIDDQDTAADENADCKRAEDTGIVKVEAAEDGETGHNEIIEDGDTTDNETASGGETRKTSTSNQVAESGDSIAKEATDDAKTVDGGIVNETTLEDTETSEGKITDDSETDDDGTAEDGETVENKSTDGEGTPNAKMGKNGEPEEGGLLDESNMAEVEETPEIAKDREQVDDGITDGQTGHDQPTDDEELTGTDREAHGETVDAGTAEDEERISDGSVEAGDTVDDGKVEEEEIADHGTTQEEAIGYGETEEANESFESGETDNEVNGETDESRSDEDEKAVKGETGPLASSGWINKDNVKAEIPKLICQCQDKLHLETPEKHKVNVNGNLVNIGESAEGGDEAEDETEPDESMQTKNSLATPQSVHDDVQASGRKMNLPSVVNMYTGSEDGAEADGEDSETEVHAKNGSIENEDDCQCNCSG